MSEITTKRLVLRRFKPSDWQDLFEYMSVPDVVRFMPEWLCTPEIAGETASERSHMDTSWVKA